MALAEPKRDNLLIEIGVEELPSMALQALGQAFVHEFTRGLVEACILKAEHVSRYFATPRRLAIWVEGVSDRQPDRVVDRRGPSLQAAFDEHNEPSRAAQGFAKSVGVRVADLDTLKTDKGSWLVYRQSIVGVNLLDIVTDCLEKSLRELPIAKRMRWGSGSVEFIRPARWLVALYGDNVVKTEVLGLPAGRLTRGHRFHAKAELSITHADDYLELLKSNGNVIADFGCRRDAIKNQITGLMKGIDARVQIDSTLLDLVTGLVEMPTALLGAFDHQFLKLPAAVLVSVMHNQQKYFHLFDQDGKLLPAFITVANIAIKPSNAARIQRGNERVLRARLTDAEFFLHSDLRIPLAERCDALQHVIFHHRLGSLADKTARVVELSCHIAKQLGADLALVARAAALCKADLVTDMVGEFPELQGVIGCYYTEKLGEDKLVSSAIEQHYLPRYAGDTLPDHAVAQSIAIADRIDSLVGMFAAGEIPSGEKDPFALRRAALGVLRIAIEKQLNLDLRELLQVSRRIYEKNSAAVTPDEKSIEQVFAFMLERLKAYYQPRGRRAAEFAAVIACAPSQPLDFDRRLRSLGAFFDKQPEAAASLVAANKRIANILNKVGMKTNRSATAPRHDSALFRENAEMVLARQIEKIGAQALAEFACHRYEQGLMILSELKQPVDSFFDEVMVMHEERAIRDNRLALLSQIRELFLGVADISLMGATQ